MKALQQHGLTCIVPIKGETFSKLLLRDVPSKQSGNRASVPVEEKILPDSQPIQSITEDNIHASPSSITEQLKLPTKNQPLVKCNTCGRSFKERGLNIHMRSCEKNRNDQKHQKSQLPIIQQPEQHQQQLLPNRVTIWGDHTSEDVAQIGNAIYEEVVFWKRNIFKLPSGAAGKRYIKETTRLINIWNENSVPLVDSALKFLMIMPSILLQKPNQKSTAKIHSAYLQKRLELWENGRFDDLMQEARSIQKQLKNSTKRQNNTETLSKNFARLMLQGKVHAALRLLDNETAKQVINLTDQTVNELKELHPDSHPAREDLLMTGEVPYFDPIRFHNIDESSIAKAALRTKGAAGPSGMDADGWRRILVSKNYGSVGKDLRTEIAKMTQNLCTRESIITETGNSNIEAYTSCRLIPLEKQPSGLRPIGIGEVLRRIIGKAIVMEIKPDLAENAGCLQLCAGQPSGCEAAAHAMNDIFAEEETDAILLVDASNAFNSLNRETLLHNIRYLCPTLATYVRNCYRTPARLFVTGGVEIASSEGTTQGDTVAMPSYAIGILPLLSIIKPELDPEKMKHVAYADDLGGGSKLEKLRDWWNKCITHGPALGYHPKPSKSWLVVKEEMVDKATELFEGTGVQITCQGRKYLGGFIGTAEGTAKYVEELVGDWLKQLKRLATIAKSEPQAAYAAFTAGFRHKITYFIRTIPNIKEQMKPLDEMIDSVFIPAITDGHYCSKTDRRLLALPVSSGGMAIPIFSELCDIEYTNSRLASQHLTTNIIQQIQEYNIDNNQRKEILSNIKRGRLDYVKKELEQIRKELNKEQLRANDIAQVKGGSSWLNALPLDEEGYSLNKREFYDAISLRYRWSLKRLPTNCACGKKFTTDHAMGCLKGGFIHQRHDRIRDMVAEMIDDVAFDVHIEPHLQQVTGEELPPSANTENEARLDVAARGFWQRGEMAFFDVRVFNPFAKSHMNAKLETAFNNNEASKKRQYNQRVIQIEHGSFTPIVLSAFGGFGKETGVFISNLVRKISDKHDLPTSTVANYVRTKMSFELIRAQVMCIRGSRTRRKIEVDTKEIEVVHCASNLQS